MSDIRIELEERIAGSDDSRDRSMRAAEIAWEVRRSDPARSDAIMSRWAEDRDPVIRAILRAMQLYRQPFHALNETVVEEIETLAEVLADTPAWRGRVLTLGGLIEYELGEYQGALGRCHRALADMRGAGDRSGVAMALAGIGMIHQELGDYPAAIEHVQSAHRMYESLGDEAGIASSLNSLASLYFGLGEYDAALERFQAALAIHERNANSSSIAVALNNIAGVYFELGDYAAAMEQHGRSLAIAQEQGNHTSIAYALNNIGTIELAIGDNAAALAHFREALAIHERHGIRPGSTGSLAGIGRALLELGRIDEAIESLHAALAGATAMEAIPLVSDAHQALVAAYERAGRYREALEHLRAHLEVQNRIRSEEARQQIARIETQRRISDAEKEAEIERLRSVELAEALRQLKDAQTQLVHSEKMAGIGQLTAGIAHEINNPINYVSSSLPSVERDLQELLDTLDPRESAREEIMELADEMRSLLRTSREGARRVGEIVAGLRSFSRLDEDTLKCVDLHEGLDATLLLLGSRLDGRIRIDRAYGALPAVECFPGQINQVFMNILSNAIDAVEGDGGITIATTEADERVIVAISDTGCGIMPAHIDRIFDPFFTTKDVGQGKGLGLAICHGIIRRHGGTIAVESAPGAGATFTLTLPLTPSPPLPLSS